MPPEAHDHANCRALFARLSELIDGELTAAERRRFEGHLQACLHCGVCAATLRRTVDLCRSLEPAPLSAELTRRLGELVQQLAVKG
jgi:anti-sigma factor RsiW